MAIALRSTSTKGSTGDATTIVINVPTGVVDGDVLILQLIANDGALPTTITGWTAVDSATIGSAHTGLAIACFVRVANSEPASYTITALISAPLAAVMAAYTGVDNTSPVNAHSAGTPVTNNTSGIPCPSVTTTVNGCRVLALVDGKGTSGLVTFTPATGYTEEATADAVSGTNPHRTGSFEDIVQGTAGATGAITVLTNYNSGAKTLSFGCGLTVALAPASGSTIVNATGTAAAGSAADEMPSTQALTTVSDGFAAAFNTGNLTSVKAANAEGIGLAFVNRTRLHGPPSSSSATSAGAITADLTMITGGIASAISGSAIIPNHSTAGVAHAITTAITSTAILLIQASGSAISQATGIPTVGGLIFAFGIAQAISTADIALSTIIQRVTAASRSSAHAIPRVVSGVWTPVRRT